MIDIVSELKEFKLKKEIRLLMNKLNPSLRDTLNLSDVFLDLYIENLISAELYIYIHTKILLNRYCVFGERIFKNNIMIGVYLYDQQQQKVWIGGAPHIPQGYVEYSNGLHILQDIAPGEHSPIYTNNIVAINNVETSENLIALNHKHALLSNHLSAFCCIPIPHSISIIGHIVLFSSEPFDWSKLDTSIVIRNNHLLGCKLLDAKERFIRVATNYY